MKALPRWAVATYLSCASTLAFAGNLPGGTGSNFWVGYNEAWFGQNYPNSLASNPFFNINTSYYDPIFVDTMFAGMASGGAKIVRIWLFPALQCIQLGQCKPTNGQTVGLTQDLIGNADLNIIGNLEDVVVLAQHYHLKVYLTALNGNDMKVATSSLRTYFSNTNGETACFQNNALLPLLKLLNKCEVPWCHLCSRSDQRNRAVLNAGYFPNGWTGARNWIANMAAFVKSNTTVPPATASWLPVTSAAGWGYAVPEITFGLFSGLGLNFYDLHVYADSGQYSGETALCNKVSADSVPIILGEYGRKSQSYSDSLQATATYNFINGAKNFINGGKGYCFWAALAWKYESSGAQSQPWFTYLVLPKYCSLYPSGPSCDISPQLSGPPYSLCPSHTCQFPYVRPAYNVIKCFPLTAC
jgi:hypothetical protein